MIALAITFVVGAIFGAFGVIVLTIAIEDLENKKNGPTGPAV